MAGILALMRAIWRTIFPFGRNKTRDVPVIHEDVTLTPEGAEVWKQLVDPKSPVGKPSQHRRRRMVNGDATP